MNALKDLANHSVAINTVGSSFHYSLALIAEKYGFDIKTVAIKPLQTNSAEAAALAGRTVDAAIIPNVYGLGPVNRRQAMVWPGSATKRRGRSASPWSRPRPPTRVRTMCRISCAPIATAQSFTTMPSPEPTALKNGPDTEAVMAIVAKTIGQKAEDVMQAIAYADPEERLDVKDILHQIDWFRAQGMIRGDFDADAIIDKRYVIPLR